MKRVDLFGRFLTEWGEYLEGKRAYEDVTFATSEEVDAMAAALRKRDEPVRVVLPVARVVRR